MFAKLYFIALAIFFMLDMLWLGVVAKDFYAKQIGSLLKEDVNWVAAFAFYFLFVFAMVIFVIQPAVRNHSWQHALVYGALYGLVTYATYDLTNLAVAKGWPLRVTLIDMAWGATLAASVSTLTYALAIRFKIIF